MFWYPSSSCRKRALGQWLFSTSLPPSWVPMTICFQLMVFTTCWFSLFVTTTEAPVNLTQRIRVWELSSFIFLWLGNSPVPMWAISRLGCRKILSDSRTRAVPMYSDNAPALFVTVGCKCGKLSCKCEFLSWVSYQSSKTDFVPRYGRSEFCTRIWA